MNRDGKSVAVLITKEQRKKQRRNNKDVAVVAPRTTEDAAVTYVKFVMQSVAYIEGSHHIIKYTHERFKRLTLDKVRLKLLYNFHVPMCTPCTITIIIFWSVTTCRSQTQSI